MTTTLSPSPARPASVFLSPYSWEAIPTLRTITTIAPASAVYPAAQRALYFPFRLYRQETVYRFFWVNGTTASTDNFQVGVYDTAGNSIKLGTSTLASGASACQFDNIADFVLYPGVYFMAIWGSGTTAHLMRCGPTLRFMRAIGVFQQSSLAGGLPTTATFATAATGYIPIFGLALRASP